MAGWNPEHQYCGNIGTLKIECGDPSYSEVSTRKISVPTTLTHIVAGFLFPDASTSDTMIGRATPRIGEPSGGLLCFSLSDNSIGTAYYPTYIAIGW